MEKNTLRELISKNVGYTIGCFGLPLDSSASAYASSEDPLSCPPSDYQSPPMLPSDMFDDSPVHINCVIAIKATMDEMRSQHEATHQLLQDVLDRLSPTQAQNVQGSVLMPPARQSPSSSIPMSSAGQKKFSLKPSLPSEFNRDRASGKAFLTSCQTYLCLCPKAFENDDLKIIWAMSYMKARRTGRWATWEFEQEAKGGHLHFLDWPDFEVEFWKDFMPLDSEATVINILETTAYFQGKWTVNDYLNQFRNLIYDSGYTDPKTVVVKFRRSLNCQISMALASMASGRPLDTQPEAWYCLTVQMDQNQAANEAFQASYRFSTPADCPHTSVLP